MRIKYFVSVLLILLCPILLGACDPPPGLTPIDTSAGTLLVTVGITDDQDASNAMSDLTLQFRTDLVAEDNYAIFTHQEAITCGNAKLTLGNAPTYTLSVKRGSYNCTYKGYTPGIGLRAAPMINVAARSMLAPQQPSVSSQGYIIHYTPDASGLACSPTTAHPDDGLTAYASDNANTIHGSTSSSNQGKYQGPDISSLSGDGTVLLKRMCSWTLHSPFDTVNLTYQSTAKADVTWGH